MKFHRRVHNSPPLVSILCQMNPLHIPTSYPVIIYFNIIAPPAVMSVSGVMVKFCSHRCVSFPDEGSRKMLRNPRITYDSELRTRHLHKQSTSHDTEPNSHGAPHTALTVAAQCQITQTRSGGASFVHITIPLHMNHRQTQFWARIKLPN